MFRNALRQSSRTVGVISASGRVAAVRTLHPIRPYPHQLQSISINQIVLWELNWVARAMPVESWELFRSFEELFLFFRVSANWRFVCRDEMPRQQLSMQHRNKSEAMQPTRRHLRLKSPPSSNKESEVFRRNPVSPRLDVFFLSGTFST